MTNADDYNRMLGDGGPRSLVAATDRALARMNAEALKTPLPPLCGFRVHAGTFGTCALAAGHVERVGSDHKPLLPADPEPLP